MFYDDFDLNGLDLDELVESINEKYDYLYDHEDEIDHDEYLELMYIGEAILQDEPDFIRELCAVREDLFTSDRELAALAMALEEKVTEED
jgi:hypothetical protein